MSDFSAIRTERLSIRPAWGADAGAVVRYHSENRDHLAPWEPTRPADFYSVPFWKAQLERSEEERLADRALRLWFFARDAESRILGTAHFSQITRGVFHACTLGYSVSREMEGHGIMREGLAAAIQHVFMKVRLHRIQANYIPTNVRSGRLLRRLGFAVEGYARDYLFIGGRWQDHVLTSLTNADWDAGARGAPASSPVRAEASIHS